MTGFLVQGGSPPNLSVTTAKIVDDAVTLAKMAAGTDGNLITYDASGNPAAVATGSATHVLTSNGAGAAPPFQAAGGGKILQVVAVESDTTGSFSSSSTDAFANITGVVAAITPGATSSKILAIVNTVLAKSLVSTIHVALFRDSTKLGAADASARVGGNIAILPSSQAQYALEQWPVSFHYVDSPSSTSELTYQLKATLGDTYSGTIYFNRTENDTDASYGARSRASITLLEIDGS